MAKVYRLNIKECQKAIAENPELQDIIEDRARRNFEVSKKSLLGEFNRHPVSKEIDAGISGKNTSGTLGGKGNLFSFIGFESDNRPVQQFYKFLSDTLTFTKRKSRAKVLGNNIFYNFYARVPTEDEIIKQAPIPWETGRSWVFDIESGISGLSNYISKLGLGRSGGGAQTKKPIRRQDFRATEYWSKMWNNFIRKLGRE